MKHALVALALAASAFSVPAVAYDFNLSGASPGPTLSIGDTALGVPGSLVLPGSFSNDWYFTLAASTPRFDVALSDLVNILPFGTTLNINSLSAGFGLLGSLTVPNNATMSATSFYNVAAGTYKATVTGSASGLYGGSYALSVAAAVPEPHEWAMLLAGLGIVGTIAARRRTRPT